MSVWGRVAVLGLALVTACSALIVAQPTPAAPAVSGSDFDPGYIISDDLFYDSAAMSAPEIQSFLDSKIGTCLTDRCLNVAMLPVSTRAAYYLSLIHI